MALGDGSKAAHGDGSKTAHAHPVKQPGKAPAATLTARGITVEGVSAGYRGRPVLHGIDLAYGPGLHLLIGPNGAGKTTLFRVLSGVLAPARGQVLIAGRDPHADPGAKALTGVASHRAALSGRLTVTDNLRFWARVLALPRQARDGRVRDMLSALSLDGIAGQRAGTLSRGQAQRVALARALLGDPPVLLLDEPTAGLDPAMATQLKSQLRALADDGRTIVVSSHDLAETGDLADDVTILRHGRIAGLGDAGSLREAFAGRSYRLRLRGRGDLAGCLAGFGYEVASGHGTAVLVDVADETAAEDLVRRLVGAGIGIHEVTPAGNALEEVYLRLAAAGTESRPDAAG